MKRSIAVLAVFLMTLMVSTEALADDTGDEIFAVYAEEVPAIDGVMSPGEWEGAVEYALDEDSAAECEGAPGSDAGMAFFLMWNESGLYMYAAVEDMTMAPPVKAGNPLNVTDAVQLGINLTNKKGNEINDAYFFSFATEIGDGGGAAWYEHFAYGGASETAGIMAAGERKGESYTLEIFLPWEALRHMDEDFTIFEGMKIGAGITLVDYDENVKQICIYKSWTGWQIGGYNSIVLCPPGWEMPSQYSEEERSFAQKKEAEEPQSGMSEVQTVVETAEETEQSISLIVLVFARRYFWALFL